MIISDLVDILKKARPFVELQTNAPAAGKIYKESIILLAEINSILEEAEINSILEEAEREIV